MRICIILSIFFSFLISNNLIAQSKKVKTEDKKTTKPIKKEIQPTNIIFPVMTEEELNEIVNPIEGMVIYNKTTKTPQIFDGTSWESFKLTTFKIGEVYQDGIIFYLDSSGKHGLSAALSDYNVETNWGYFENQVGASDKAIGTGKSNTNKIIKNSISTDTIIASRVCRDLSLKVKGDWFLPSLEELNLMHKNLKLKGLGNFSDQLYWSSSETDFNNAWAQDFKSGIQIERNTNVKLKVRAIKAF